LSYCLKKGVGPISKLSWYCYLSSIPKFFEKMITCQLQHHCRSIISPCRRGFTRCRSTSTNLLEWIFSNLSNRTQMVCFNNKISSAAFGHSAARIADRTRSNANLDWTCPTCLHIQIDIRALALAFMRQTDLEFQALRAEFKS